MRPFDYHALSEEFLGTHSLSINTALRVVTSGDKPRYWSMEKRICKSKCELKWRKNPVGVGFGGEGEQVSVVLFDTTAVSTFWKFVLYK